jgi:N-acetylmuramoyl-L-alanine amidase
MNNLKINPAFLVRKQYKKITFAVKYTIVSFLNCGKNMKFTKKYFLVYQSCILLIGLILSVQVMAQETRFTVVLDAGHGGHDPGAVGSITREKDINLAVVLNLGKLIEQNYKDVKVVYTRKTDKYLTLQERADIVNRNHADLFICIHTNAAKSSSAYGAETFTLGLAKSKANLDVAMRENSVIMLEDDYKTKYKGFDPTSVDSYIMFEFMQDKYIDKSIEFSSAIQKQFVSYCRRSDRGVRQAGFWVLHRSACPSVLIELGFISNRAEERYLASDKGRAEMATAISNAFVDYKRSHDKMSGRQSTPMPKVEKAVQTEAASKPETLLVAVDSPVKPHSVSDSKTSAKNAVSLDDVFNKPVFKVQLFATTKTLSPNAPDFKGLKNTDYFVEGGFKKYTIGAETDYMKIEQLRVEVNAKFPQAFVIAFVGKNKISVKDALALIK